MADGKVIPVALFTYRRPEHLSQTLKALSENVMANRVALYIFSDGPKSIHDSREMEQVRLVRKIVREQEWGLSLEIIESGSNKGLSKSVMDGVSFVLSRHDHTVIVEDDIVTSKNFLSFLSQALHVYKDENLLAGVSGYSYPGLISKSDTYVLRVGSCWGWGTWSRVWENTLMDADQLIASIGNEPSRISEFNAGNSYPYFEMLKDVSKGHIDSWAVRFYASYFLQHKYFLYPRASLVRNIGRDGSGVHQVLEPERIPPQEFSDQTIIVERRPIEENIEMERTFKHSLGKHSGMTGYSLKAFSRRAIRKLRNNI